MCLPGRDANPFCLGRSTSERRRSPRSGQLRPAERSLPQIAMLCPPARLNGSRNGWHECRTLNPGLRILVIDDNSDHAESTATLLRLYGHLPEVAKDGAGRVDRSSPSVARRSADPYIEKLKALVKAKTKGEELVARRTKRVGFVLSPPPPRAGRRGRGHRPRLAMPARRE